MQPAAISMECPDRSCFPALPHTEKRSTYWNLHCVGECYELNAADLLRLVLPTLRLLRKIGEPVLSITAQDVHRDVSLGNSLPGEERATHSNYFMAMNVHGYKAYRAETAPNRSRGLNVVFSSAPREYTHDCNRLASRSEFL